MSVLIRLLGLRLRSGLRGLRDHAFALLVLGPIVLGGALWSLERWVQAGRESIRGILEAEPLAIGRVLALLATLGLAELARRELHPRGEPWSAVLPVAESVRWVQAFAALLAQAAIPTVAVAVLVSFLAGETTAGLLALVPVWSALVPTIPCAMLLAALGIRWRPGIPAMVVVATGLLGTSSSSAPVAGVAWAPWHAAATDLGGILASAVPGALGGPEAPAAWIRGISLLVPAAGALLLHLRWGRLDLERAGGRVREVRARNGGPSTRSPSPVAALVLRDLRLIRRGFSARVPATVAVAAALLLVGLDSGIRTESVGSGLLAVASALVLCSLVPGLVAREEAATWNDRTLGFRERDRLRAKLRLGAVLALVPAGVGAALVLAGPGPVPAAVVALAVAVGASTMTAASFELPDDPGLAAIWGTLIGGALALLILLVPEAWWMWTVLWAVVLGQLVERGDRRLRRPRELR